MAGPGGGPARKSHTKSRKGCRTCKNRHIRCDEHFPQCRNCTKHSVRCDYMDMTNAGEEPAKGAQPPELLITPEILQMLDSWRLTNEAPLRELQHNDSGYWSRFSTIDLRLVHHIATLASDMKRRGYDACTAWTPQMTNLIAAALSSDFVMHALLALSASHLAWQTKNSDTENLAYHHRGIALKGLHEAIGSFSEQSSDAILASSMLLSWQATDWRGWVSLQQGVSTVLAAMRQWMHKSELATFVESQRMLAKARLPTTPSLTGFPPQRSTADDARRLSQLQEALHSLRLRLTNYADLVPQIDWLSEYVQQVQQEYPIASPEQAFDRLLQLRSQLFWLPPALLKPDESDLGALALLAHLNAVALVLEPLYPEVGGLYLGTMSLAPIERMHEIMQVRRSSRPHEHSLQVAISLMETPTQLALAYRNSHQTAQQSNDGLRYSASAPSNLYINRSGHIVSPTDATRHASFGASTVQSPQSTSLSANPYYPPYASPTFSHGAVSDPRSSTDLGLSTSSPFTNLAYSTQQSSTGPVSHYDYFPPSQYQQPYGSISDYNRPNVHLAPIVPSSTYSTVPPPPGSSTRQRPDEASHLQEDTRGEQGAWSR